MRNLRSLFAMQEEDGFVGHMIFWRQALPLRRSDVMQARPRWRALRPHMSALTQPCLAAMALLCLFEASGVPYEELLQRLIALALERHERRSKLVY